MSGTQATQILEAVAKAAEAASQAALALRESNDQAKAQRSGFAEASKVVKCPASFGSTSSTEDQANWLDFAFSFKQWLVYAEPGFETDLKHVEDHLNVPVTYTATPEGAASEVRSKKLYAILSGLLQQRPLKLLKQVPNSNGMEVWRQLSSLYTPKTKSRALGILSALMTHPAFTREKTLLEQVQGLERIADEYRKSSGADVADDILLTTLVKCLPKQLQQHVQLNMTETSTFAEIKEKVIAFERLSTTWSKEKVYSELGAVTSYASDSGGMAPMEINQVSKGKSKGKGKGKSPQKGKGKDKGKSKDAKGKGKSQQNGKGYSTPSKGGGKTQAKQTDVNRCNYCGAFGHWKKDCRKFQADKASGAVRQVEADDNNSQRVASSPSSTGTAQLSPSATSYRSTGNVNRVAFSDSTVIIEDLTEFSDHGATSSGLVRAIQQLDPIQFDMACTDDDGNWTCEPDFKEPNRFHHVRMMTQAGSTSADIILDSGADTSALPLAYCDVGESCSHETIGHDYIDAQGGKLDIRDTRLATVDLGNGVVLRERFIIANISCPLLALGHIIRAGWELQHTDSGICLVKHDRFVNVHFKRNSLCVQGCIRMISEDDVLSPKSSTPSVSAVRAIHLERVLRRLLPGWNKINPQVYALTTRRAKFVDTTICPAEEMMWLRTTLVFRDGQGWELLEFSEPVSDMDDMEGDIYDPESVVEVLTLAHVHSVPSEELGFRIAEDDSRPIFDDDIDVDDAENPQQAQPVEETPADVPEAEPLDEDRMIPYFDESTITIDGITYTHDTPLRALRAGCTSLGLSKRGSKKECMKRMIEFVKTRELMEAQAVEAKLKKDVERHAVPQRKPVEPSAAVRDAHNLTHEPYETWCPLCVAHRARQDGHRPQTHEAASHSVISFDFFFCSRMKDETDKLTVLVLSDRDTGLCLALPTLQKVVHAEPAPTGDHQANGAAESMVGVLRSKANLLVSQIEEATGCKGPIFGCMHPVYAWALIHSAWLHNHFSVKRAMTSYERTTGRFYSGKVAMYGETVFGYLKTSLKGLPQWTKGIWLSKTMSNDCHIIGTPTGIFTTRSIRRLPDSFQLEMLGEITASPWEYGYANLGHRLVYSKRSSLPPGVAVGTTLNLGDRDALAVRDYARAHPYEDVDAKALSAEVGDTAVPITNEPGEQQPIHMQGDEGSATIGPVPEQSTAAASSDAPRSNKRDAEHEDSGGDSKRLHSEAVDAQMPHGDVVPQTPQSEAGRDLVDDTSFEDMMSPNKIAKHGDGPGSVSLLGQLRQIEHLDIEPDVVLQDQDFDVMLQHELNLDEDPYEPVSKLSNRMKELSFPYGSTRTTA